MLTEKQKNEDYIYVELINDEVFLEKPYLTCRYVYPKNGGKYKIFGNESLVDEYLKDNFSNGYIYFQSDRNKWYGHIPGRKVFIKKTRRYEMRKNKFGFNVKKYNKYKKTLEIYKDNGDEIEKELIFKKNFKRMPHKWIEEYNL